MAKNKKLKLKDILTKSKRKTISIEELDISNIKFRPTPKSPTFQKLINIIEKIPRDKSSKEVVDNKAFASILEPIFNKHKELQVLLDLLQRTNSADLTRFDVGDVFMLDTFDIPILSLQKWLNKQIKNNFTNIEVEIDYTKCGDIESIDLVASN